MLNTKSFDYAIVGSVLHYCTLHDRVKIKTPSRAELAGFGKTTYRAVCLVCQTEFRALMSKQIYCSEKCKKQAHVRVCLNCGVTFTPFNPHSRAKCCSISCGAEHRHKKAKG